MTKKLMKYIRRGYSTAYIAAVIVKNNPDYDVSPLIQKGYIKQFPYTPELLWRIRDKWYSIHERNIEKKFLRLLKEVQNELQ